MRSILTAFLLVAILSCGSSSNQSNKDRITFELAKIATPVGEIIFLLADETPRHKASFITLVKEQYFNSYTFNRVINNFVAQGGCPDTPEGFTDSPYLLEPEFTAKVRHVYGAVGAGRDDNPQMLSAGCQFYIVQNKDGLPRLDDKYTVFGQVVKGMDVVDKIVDVATDSLDQPLVPLTLSIEIITLDSIEISGL